MPNLYIIAGCNGAGKTTTSFTVLPEILDCKEFVNADEIARGLSPFQPETVSIQSGKIMLNRIQELIKQKKEFGFETTLATKSYVNLIEQAKDLDYKVILIYFWLESVELAKERVKKRVEKGGHNIPEPIIERRYYAGIKNLFSLYINKVDNWIICDNSSSTPVIVATGRADLTFSVLNDDLWKRIKVLS